MSTERDDLWSQEQTAEVVGQSVDTLRTWRHRGGGPVYVKSGRKVQYFKSDVMEWLRGNRYSRTDQKLSA